MKIILTLLDGTPILINDNWRAMQPNSAGGTFIEFSNNAEGDVVVQESFDEICEAVKASRRFSQKSNG